MKLLIQLISPTPTHPVRTSVRALDLLIQQIFVRACPAAKFKMRSVAHGASAINSMCFSRENLMDDDRSRMDILQEWLESGEELQSTGLFCHDVPEHLPALGKR